MILLGYYFIFSNSIHLLLHRAVEGDERRDLVRATVLVVVVLEVVRSRRDICDLSIGSVALQVVLLLS